MSNQTTGHSCDPDQQWRVFDALPRRLKEVFWAAPYDFDVVLTTRALARCGGA